MVENNVVKEQLTDAMVDAGAELIRRLDELGVAPQAAFWLFMPDINEWRLLFASPELAAEGPRSVYRRILDAITSLGDKAAAAPLAVVGLLNPDDDLVRVLRTAIPTGPGISRIRISKNAVNGHFIDDALIYRIT